MKFARRKFALLPLACLGLWGGMVALPIAPIAQALPGQRVEEVEAWIRSHPTLKPASGEKLLIRKSDTASRRFVFQASVLPPGQVTPPADPGIVRHEKLSLFDVVNGVTRDRLEESLRNIYGLEIYQDYTQGQVVYLYPDQTALAQARNRSQPLLAALQGELRIGDRYAYWVEIVRNQRGLNHAGQIMILLKTDVEKLQTELQRRKQ